MMSQAAATPFQSASLYVGDLHKDIAESALFDLFSRVGPVVSIRVCRDSITRRSLGYAYVNFQNMQDAERALDTMNFSEINGKPCRIMWSQRDPSLRKTGMGNVYVSNLAPSVDNKGIYDTFSVFGNILSCKVVTDETGASKGYGYVHFETAEAAIDAIQKFDGTLIDDVEVRVGHFVKRQERTAAPVWTNLYIKQFPLTWDEAKIRDIFSACGAISNVAISRDADGKSKGFGFVNMADHDAAVKAVADLHNKTFEEGDSSFTLYVGQAQKKTDRVRELKGKREQLNADRVTKYQGMNLYVKNISDTITDELFREVFVPFGDITSAKIMRDEAKVSRGFGFVCYATSEEAAKAVAEMNGKVLGGKPLVVTFYQRKEIRRVQLAASYAPNVRFPQGMTPGMPMPPFMGMYMPQGQQFPGQQPRGAPYPYPGAGMGAPRGPGPRGNPQYGGPRPGQAPGPNNFFPPNAMPQYGMPPQGMGAPQGQMGYKPRPQAPYPMGPQGGMPGYAPNGPGQGPANRRPQGPGMPQGMSMPPQGMAGPGPQGMPQGMPRGPMGQMAPRGPMGYGPGPMQGGVPMQPMPMQMPPQQQPVRGVKFTNQARNQNGPMPGNMGMMAPNQAMPMAPMAGMQQQQQQQKMDFSEALLNTTDPMAQKNMIGERLYPLIYPHAPEQAGKITGMLLEMDNGELLNLIESPDALMSKIDEALTVLRNHKANAE